MMETASQWMTWEQAFSDKLLYKKIKPVDQKI